MIPGIPNEVLVKIAQTRREYEEELTRIFVKGWPQDWGETEVISLVVAAALFSLLPSPSP